VTKLSKAGHLDAESIAEVKTRITSHTSTTLPIREKVAVAAPLVQPPSRPTGSRCVQNPSPSPLPENNNRDGRYSLSPRRQQHYTREFHENDRLEVEVWEMRRDVHPSDSHIVLVKEENKQSMDNLKVFSGKTRDSFRVYHKSVETYLRYERKKFTLDVDKINWLGGWLEG
jgi:hypothetical protein